MSLNNFQYDSIIREYNRKQIVHRHALEERRASVFAVLPRLEEIDREIASASTQTVRRLLAGDESALAESKKQIAALSEERRIVLCSGGYPASYLEMTYDCPDCKDTGYIDGVKCHCFKKAEIDLLYTQSHLQDVLAVENFDTFSYDYYSDEIIDPARGISSLENIHRIIALCRNAVQDFDNTPANLFFFGDTGVGKTFLSHCIAKELLDSTHSVVYFSARDLFETFAEKRFSRAEQTSISTDAIYSCDLLIIDDLGTELTNTFVNSELFFCINERLINHKSTIISTNLSLQAFADTYSERIFSRISNNYTMLKMFGKDIRLLKRLQQKKP
ncbi:MAG: ATP-binding protein [Eubacteriales bacterium]|nr:ATP-binding protein [Eubacteriales bacterium]